MSRITAVCVVIVLTSIAMPMKVFAYLDPGTGSYVLQIVMAAVLGLLYAAKLYWRKIRSVIQNLFSQTPKENGK